MRMRSAIMASLIIAPLAPAAAAEPERPPILSRVVQCRSITDPTERLACFDREVAAMDAAEASKQLVIMDRQQIRKTRTSLFGLTLPNLGIFGDDKLDEGGASRIETTIKSVRADAYGKFIMELADGARWIQIDSRNLAIDPRAGHKIVIRKASLGSYLANVNGQTAIKVRRIS